MHAANHPAPATTLNTSALSVAEVAGFTGYSRQTVTKMFEDEPGVLVINRPETRNKRSYRSIRIPRCVYERVIRKVAN
jgi:hypothetical protein